MSQPTVLITGAAIRLGKATAEAFFARGCNLVLHYNNSQHSAKTLQQSFNQIRPKSCEIIQANLADIQSTQELIEQCEKTFGRLDHLVNNASLFYPTPFAQDFEYDANNQDLDILLDVNFKAPSRLARLAYPLLKQRHGSITNLIDIYADAGLSGHTAYVASKSALKQMTLNQAVEFAPNVRVNGVSPGAILWPDNDEKTPAATNDSEDTGKTEILKHTANKKLGSPTNIASTIVYLALDASYTTGSIIKVDSARRWYL
ncbi:SDR family oxidoreductase [Aliikangiella coralliicola]|uniref:SDR family oxidoreductase n=1 Tax=Aliikangiella coralliicola TaxID=2592383 RepID=A0A545UE15_9GAMM|nr:SDR family oxidoreductase [Aliikangiella coralliicola]TQV87706.1 SDR family oxidoreductase [Aliikangiella coralliicola]